MSVEGGSSRLEQARFKAGLTFGSHLTPDLIIDAAITRAELVRKCHDYWAGPNMPQTLRSISDVVNNGKLSEEGKRKAVSRLLGLEPSNPIKRIYQTVKGLVRQPSVF